MNALLTVAKPVLPPLYSHAFFQVLRSHQPPHYYQLSLRDAAGEAAHWVIPVSLKHVAKRTLLVWRLAPAPATSHLLPVDSGALQLAACQVGTRASLAGGLALGLLRLRFQGELLNGYFRLECLPTGNGQLWQLMPIGQV